MVTSKRQQTTSEWMTASQLAEMGFCERKLVLKSRFGPRETHSRRIAQQAGMAEHRKFLDAAFREQPLVISSFYPNGMPDIASAGVPGKRLLEIVKRIFFELTGGVHGN